MIEENICKKCIHRNICRYYEPECCMCNQFVDKSRFIELPCKIGQDAWVIRSYKGIKQPQKSEISEMYFTQQMKLIIVVKYVGRGRVRQNRISYKRRSRSGTRGKE